MNITGHNEFEEIGNMDKFPRYQHVNCIKGCLLGLVMAAFSLKVAAEEYTLFVQPVQSQEQTQRAFKPLTDYLSARTGQKFKVETTLNFVTYWSRMRKQDGFDLVLDAAHFTDYRIKKLGFQVLVKLPDTVSYSLVTNESLLLFDAEELIGKKVATAPSPSLGGVRLAQLYPNTLRQPVSVPTNNFADALTRVRSKAIDGALVPTPLVSGDSTVNTVMTTEPVPHMGLSASKKVPAELRNKIRKALLDAHTTPDGQAMLQKINIQRFNPANAKQYDGYASLLEDVWGY
jgi:hypothetical protein